MSSIGTPYLKLRTATGDRTQTVSKGRPTSCNWLDIVAGGFLSQMHEMSRNPRKADVMRGKISGATSPKTWQKKPLKHSHRSLSVIYPHMLSLQWSMVFWSLVKGYLLIVTTTPGAIIIAKQRDLINHILVDCSDSPGRNLDLKDGDMDMEDIHTQYQFIYKLIQIIQLNNIWICKHVRDWKICM